MKTRTLLSLLAAVLALTGSCRGRVVEETSPENQGAEKQMFTIVQKISNRPSVAVLYPWPEDCPGETWFDCDSPQTPYALVWTSAGIAREIDSLEIELEPEESRLMRSDPDTLYLVNEEWHYWNRGWRSLSKTSPFYLDEVFAPHGGSEYGRTLLIDFTDPDWPDLLAEKALRFQSAGYDGMIFDWWSDENGSGLDPEVVREARLAIARAAREKVGPDFILMGNVNWNRDDPTAAYLSGAYLELWKEPPSASYAVTYAEEDQEGKWTPSLERMEDLVGYWDTHLQPPAVVACEAWKITGDEEEADRLSPLNLRWAKLTAALCLVNAERGYVLYADNNGDRAGDDHGHAYYDFYRVDLGDPLSGKIEIAPGAAYKQYERGLIAYNRTREAVTLALPGGGPLVLEPLTGVFLVFANGE